MNERINERTNEQCWVLRAFKRYLAVDTSHPHFEKGGEIHYKTFLVDDESILEDEPLLLGDRESGFTRQSSTGGSTGGSMGSDGVGRSSLGAAAVSFPRAAGGGGASVSEAMPDQGKAATSEGGFKTVPASWLEFRASPADKTDSALVPVTRTALCNRGGVGRVKTRRVNGLSRLDW